MTRAGDGPPTPVPTLCWRCGRDCSDRFDLIRVRGRVAAVCKDHDPACVPTLVKEETR